jgi:FkbM family methyltransferase
MFISYAQNFEDVILNRLFKDKNDGFYIDIGANHPVFDSVTMAFYERGWTGINIEPMPVYYELLCEKRSRDINLNCAVSDQEKTLDFYDLEATGYSTLDKTVAETLVNEKGLDLKVYQVQTRSLEAIANQYVHCPIDFMKIDVEGWEKPVVLSHDWENFRPKVVIIEATFPGKTEHLESGIQDFLQTKNYTKVYFDGLNDFYLANELSNLSHHFGLPPNVFDDFKQFLYVDLQQHVQNLETLILARNEEIDNLNQLVISKSNEINTLQQSTFELKNKILTNEKKLDDKILDLENHLQNLTRKNFIIENYLDDEKFETQRLKLEIKKLNELNEKHLIQLDIALNNVTIEKNSLLQNNNVLNEKNERLQEIINAIKTSKFWKIRLFWFKVKAKLGIPFKDEIIWSLIIYTIIKESKHI